MTFTLPYLTSFETIKNKNKNFFIFFIGRRVVWEEADLSEMAESGCFLNTFLSDYGRVPSSRWLILETKPDVKE